MTFLLIALSACNGITPPVEFTINFDSNGGTLVETIICNGEEMVTIPDNPTREGYTFSGWYWDNETYLRPFTASSLLDETIQSDLTVYARWQINTYKLNFFDDNENLIQSLDVFYGDNLNLIQVPTLEKEGYILKWSQSLPEQMPPHDLDLFATYERALYTVTYEIDGLGVMLIETVYYGESATAPEPPTKEGYVFVGWDKDLTNIKADIITRPLYDKKAYSVNFVDHMDVIIKTETVYYGESATAPEPPINEGYIFSGWDIDFTQVKNDLFIRPTYSIDEFEVTQEFTDSVLLNEIYKTLNKSPNEIITTSDLLKITIFITSANITSIDGLEYMRNLEIISLENANILDASPLSNLNKLRHLALHNSKLTSLEFVKSLTQLEGLHIIISSINDLSPLENMSNLKMLSIQRAPVSDLSPLANLINLESLYLAELDVMDISALSNLVKLRDLSLPYCQIKDIAPLSSLLNLTSLSITGNKNIESFDVLNDLSKLIYLSLNDTSFDEDDIILLKSLDDLMRVFLPNITQLNGIDQLPSHVSIHLWGLETHPALDHRYYIIEAQLNYLKQLLLESNSQIEMVYKVNNYINHIVNYWDDSKGTIKDILLYGAGMCSSHSTVTDILLNSVGIHSFGIGGEGHGWNAIEIDNECYHLDVYWNDPVGYHNDVLMNYENSYTYFMLSDEKILTYRGGPMYDWTSPNTESPKTTPCDSTKYDLLGDLLFQIAANQTVYLLDEGVIYFDAANHQIKITDYSQTSTRVITNQVEQLIKVADGKVFYINNQDFKTYTINVDGTGMVYNDQFFVVQSSHIQAEINVDSQATYTLTLNKSITTYDQTKIYYQDTQGNIIESNVSVEKNLVSISPVSSFKSEEAYTLFLLPGAIYNTTDNVYNNQIERFFITEQIPNPFHLQFISPVDGNLPIFDHVTVDNANTFNVVLKSDVPIWFDAYDDQKEYVTIVDSHGEHLNNDPIYVKDKLMYSFFENNTGVIIDMTNIRSAFVIGETYTITIPVTHFKSIIDSSGALEPIVFTITIVDGDLLSD